MLTLFLSNLIAGQKKGVLNASVAKISKSIEGMSLVFWGHFHRDSIPIFDEDTGYLHKSYVASFIKGSKTILKPFNEHSFLKR